MTKRTGAVRFAKLALLVAAVLTLSAFQCGGGGTGGGGGGGTGGGGGGTGGGGGGTGGGGGGTIPPGVLVRKNVNSLSPAEITSLRAGIAAMKARPESDPTSWLYQANIHGTTQGAAQPGWNQCQHGIFQFLGWHRLYVYYFERILRDAANDPNLTLPYWNYSDTSSADNRAIPLPYRNPARAQAMRFSKRIVERDGTRARACRPRPLTPARHSRG